MNIPGFNAEASLCPSKGRYQVNSVFGRSAGAEVLPMLPRRPTVDSAYLCFKGAGESSCDGLICSCCYDDGCWICDNFVGTPANCVWDDSYRKRAAARPFPRVFTGSVF